MGNQLVSVIIPTKNRAVYLKEAIDSVYAQTYRNFEILVIDDGSTDATSSVVSAYDTSLQYFFQASKGASAARNFGIEKAQGEWIAFLDDDDIWEPDKLRLCMEQAEQDPHIVWLCSGFSFIDAKSKPLPRVAIVHEKQEITLHDIAMFTFIQTSTVMARKSNLVEAGGFPEGVLVSEDYHTWAKILRTGKGAALPQALSRFRRHAGNTKLPYREVLKENTRIIDAVLASGAAGLQHRSVYMQNLHRIIADTLWHQKKYFDYMRFKLFNG